SMTMFTSSTLEVAAGNDRSTRAFAAAESGITFVNLQFKTLALNGKMPITSSGAIDSSLAHTLFCGTWTGGNLQQNLSAQLNGTANLQGKTCISTTTTTPPPQLLIPPISVFGTAIDDTAFTISIVQSGTTLQVTSTGRCTGVMRSVTVNYTMEKKLK